MSDTSGDGRPVGGVLVVGGGIAGMQAALDLAEAGFKVYLAETKSAIGGHMAQLDKTFPTNDCAMCTISPKLVETGRHLNIDILTDTEVLAVTGEAGNFTATLRRKPRYIDLAKCTGCGECAAVCPVPVVNPYDEGLSQRRAAYRLYPQATPGAYAIEKRGIAPCRDACPISQRTQGYIALIREGRYADAYRTIKEDNPFPAICGRVCNHRCEDACSRGKLDEPVSIMALKRFVADRVHEQSMGQRANESMRQRGNEAMGQRGNGAELADSELVNSSTHTSSTKRVAVVGSGPAGLTAALDLVRLGYGVTVFEALPVAGGMMRVGVPEYRLPYDLVQREIDDILAEGVELKLNHRVEDVEGLLDDFDAVFMAVGAHKGKKLPIPGADHPNVLVATDFLRDVALSRYEVTRQQGNEATSEQVDEVTGQRGNEATRPQVKKATRERGDERPHQPVDPIDSSAQNSLPSLGRVLVLGGGNVAIDAAMTAVRLGAQWVGMACLESRETMPAHDWEIEQAEAEKVALYPARSFTRVLTEDGRITGVECLDVSFMAFDADGRLTLETVPGSEHVIEADTIIFAIGQAPDLDCLNGGDGVQVSRRGTVVVDPETLATDRPGIFAGGDAVTGTAFIVDAIAAGHRAAQSIHAYLNAQRTGPREQSAVVRGQPPVAELSDVDIYSRLARGEVVLVPRARAAQLTAAERVAGFAEIDLGLTEEQARAEAERCLSCGICSECLQCVYACGVGAIVHDMVEHVEEINVGAVILAPGYQAYNAQLSEEFGYGRYPNVVTALQFERLLSASGPTSGHVRRLSDNETPKKIAFLQCVGSRDQSHDYCSAVCCMYAAKEAVMAKEHEPDTEVHVFMMDVRAFSKGYEEYYQRARRQYGIKYTRCRISGLREDPQTHNLIVRYVPEVMSQRGNESTSQRVSESTSQRVSESASQRVSESASQRVGESASQRVGEAARQQGSKATRQWGNKVAGQRVIEVTTQRGNGAGPVEPELVNPLTHTSLTHDSSPVVEEEFDLVVLSVGMEISESVRQLGRDLGVELDDYGFCHTVQFDPLQTSRPGIYAVGPFREPKDIPETVVDASGAAAAAGGLLAPARGTLTRRAEYPPEMDVSGKELRIGVFVCHCGSNIGGFLDVPGVAEYARSLPGVVHAEDNLYTCSQDSIAHITEQVKKLGLNRVVVASCTPRTHEPLFQDSIRQAGLNPHLFEMANIRNQCSWVHSHDWDGATQKAKDLVRMAVARASALRPLHKMDLPVEHTCLVIGGGAAGMTAALSLAEQGFPVHLVERETQLGGNLRHVHYLQIPDGRRQTTDGRRQTRGRANGATGQRVNGDPQTYLRELVESVTSHPLISVHLETELVETAGFVGNFTSTLRNGRGNFEVRHGATIVATGAQEYRGPEYGYGTDPRITTQQEFESLLAEAMDQRVNEGTGQRGNKVTSQRGDEVMRRRGNGSMGQQVSDLRLADPSTHNSLPSDVVMIQCVGPAEKYCGRICCSTALKNALKLKELDPEARVTVLYKDIRTYGFHERLYTEARRRGVLFLRYDDDHRPEVTMRQRGDEAASEQVNEVTRQWGIGATKQQGNETVAQQDSGSEPVDSLTHNLLTHTSLTRNSLTLQVKAWDPILGQEITLMPDVVVLSMPMVPAEGAQRLGTKLKVPVDLDGWFQEAHVKLRPVDFASDGVFMAGAAHYPKLLSETIVQAQAAAARAATILSKDTLSVGGVVAVVDDGRCTGCVTCVRVCPYGVPRIDPAKTGVGSILGAATIEPAMCQGCGICAAECPAKAIQLMHYTDDQVMLKVDALFAFEEPGTTDIFAQVEAALA